MRTGELYQVRSLSIHQTRQSKVKKKTNRSAIVWLVGYKILWFHPNFFALQEYKIFVIFVFQGLRHFLCLFFSFNLISFFFLSNNKWNIHSNKHEFYKQIVYKIQSIRLKLTFSDKKWYNRERKSRQKKKRNTAQKLRAEPYSESLCPFQISLLDRNLNFCRHVVVSLYIHF